MNNFLSKFKLNSQGVISPLILIGIVAVLVLFVVLGNLPIKDRLFGNLFPKSDSQAAGVVDLSLVPQTVSVAKDQTFLVDVAIDAKTDQPSAAVIAVNYDPSVLQAVAVEQGFFFTEDLDPTTPKINNGTIQMTLGQKPNQYKTGDGIVATLQFKALIATSPTSSITFNTTDTQIAAIGKTGNQVGNLANSTVTVTNTPVVNKTASFSLSSPASATAGQQFNVTLRAQTPEDANLFAARLNFDPALLEVVSIDTSSSFITASQWVNNNFDNSTGQISLIGGVPTPGFSSATPSTMATVTFRAKAAGTAQINFGANSAIYRNVDNVDILATPTGASVNITGVTPSPSPSVAPSPSPSPSVAPSPSAQPSASVAPSIQPSPSAAVSPSPAASPSAPASIAPSPSPSASPLACAITAASWVTASNPINQGKVVNLSVTGNASCAGQTVSFNVWEDDGLLGNDTTLNQPPTTKFNSNNQAVSSWLAEFQEDGLAGVGNPPEYFFLAQVTGGTPFKSASPLLQVNKVGGGVNLNGDFNRDGKVDLADLSILYSNWNKSTDFADELDLNTDGVVNAIDWGTLLQILRVGGIIQ